MTIETRRRCAVWGVSALALAIALAGCSAETITAETPTVQPTVSASKSAPPEPATAEPTPQAPVVWPLTGQGGEVVNRPVVSVKIENLAAARPQSGLEFADIVWEETVEGGITRFVAMYHSQLPDEVGPVRSIRPMDGPIAGPTHGLLAFSGGQEMFVDTARADGLQIVSQDSGAAGFSRKSGRKAPHNTYGSVATFASQADADHQNSPAPLFAYAADAATASASVAGTAVTTADLEFSSYAHPNWTWDGGAGTWLRAERSTPFVSAAGGQIGAVNVVVLRVDLVNTSVRDPAGSPVPETKIVGSGTGQVLTGGKSIDVSWSKADGTSPVVLTLADGQPATLAPGTTWVELVPNSGSVTLS